MTHDFRQDYEVLELDQKADWATARVAYRRQVRLWHPDRYAQRPRERVHAQNRFIRLTRAFDSLRNFHRENRRLPFEPVRGPRADGPETGSTRSRSDAPTARSGGSDAGPPGEDAVLEAGILNLRSPTHGRRRLRPGRLLWPLATVTVVVGMLGVFVVLDRNARQNTLEEGREVLRRTAPSEFMPSAAEVQKRSSRGAFVEREDTGRIGDQLMEDMFR